MPTVQELYEANHKRSISEVSEEMSRVGSLIYQTLYEKNNAKYYWKYRNVIDLWINTVDANIRFLKGNPSFSQDEISKLERHLATYKVRWKGIFHLLEIEFAEKFREEDENARWAEEQRREADSYFQIGDCVACAGAGCVMCTGEK